LEPVSIGGVEIRRVTGHNARFIVENVLGVGAEIELIRSGDVIPKVLSVLKKAKKADLPKGKWHWNETEVDIILDNKNIDDVLVKNIYFFFSKIEAKGLGEKLIEKMVAAKLDSIYKILCARREDLLMVEGVKEKMADNILLSIKKSTMNIGLARFMAASNRLGEGMGEERMKQILFVYPNLLLDYKKWTKTEFINNIKEINGWEEKTASLFVSNFGKFIIFYKEIEKFVSIESVIKKVGGKLEGMIIVFTGFRDKDLEDNIEKEGGKVSSSVTKNTKYVIVKDMGVESEKIKTAEKLGIKILIKDDFIKLL
jgi:NAD-dependent DNA ligase